MLRTRRLSCYSHIFLFHDLYITGEINCLYANNLQIEACEVLAEQQQKQKINHTQSVNVRVCVKWARASCYKAICLAAVCVCVCVRGWFRGQGVCSAPAVWSCLLLIDDLHSPRVDQVTTSHYWPPLWESSFSTLPTHTHTHTHMLVFVVYGDSP